MLDWISVEERLPKVRRSQFCSIMDKKILFYRTNVNLYHLGWLAKDDEEKFFLSERFTRYPIEDVTHWAEINEPRNNKVELPDLKLLEGRN